MTGYNIKGTIGFIFFVLLILISLLSGDLEQTRQLILYMIGGMILYQIIRFFIRGVSGFDPHDGTTKSEREDLKYIKKSKSNSNFKSFSEKNRQEEN